MGRQEDFRTPDGGASASPPNAAPLFDERSARKAAPVVPLKRVARRSRFANLMPGGWRETVRSPQFRRSWPLALLLVATLAAAVAAANIYSDDDAQAVTPTAGAATAEAANDTNADAEKSVAATSPNEIENPRGARDTRRGPENVVAPDAAVGNGQALAASAPGNFYDGAADEQGDAVASGRAAEDGKRDGGKRNKRSKRRQGAGRGGGGAVLFDVIR